MSSSLARRNNSYISIAKRQHVGRHWCPSHTGSTVEHKRYIVHNERIATWLWVSLCRGRLKLSAINRIRVQQPVSDIKTKGNVKRAYVKSGFFELLIVKNPFSNSFQGSGSPHSKIWLRHIKRGVQRSNFIIILKLHESEFVAPQIHTTRSPRMAHLRFASQILVSWDINCRKVVFWLYMWKFGLRRDWIEAFF